MPATRNPVHISLLFDENYTSPEHEDATVESWAAYHVPIRREIGDDVLATTYDMCPSPPAVMSSQSSQFIKNSNSHCAKG